jgi:hypothetical protein
MIPVMTVKVMGTTALAPPWLLSTIVRVVFPLHVMVTLNVTWPPAVEALSVWLVPPLTAAMLGLPMVAVKGPTEPASLIITEPYAGALLKFSDVGLATTPPDAEAVA